jgi:hypothetical protein
MRHSCSYWLTAVLAVAWVAGCNEPECESDADCPRGDVCDRQLCVPGGGAADAGDAGGDGLDEEDGMSSVDVGDTCLTVDPSDQLDFGSLNAGGRTARTVRLTNCSSSEPLNLDVALQDDADNVFGFNRDVEGLSVSPGDTEVVPITFEPASGGDYTASLVIEGDFSNREAVTVELVGSAQKKCPIARAVGDVPKRAGEPSAELSVQPLSVLELNGTGSQAREGEIDGYSWSVRQRPPGSSAFLAERSTADAQIQLDVAGTWSFSLTVTDSEGRETCEPAVVDVEVIPDEDLYLELVWDNSEVDRANAGSPDLDLHYRHPNAEAWNTSPWDVFWDNREPDWGPEAGTAHMPTDDANGWGPEVVTHEGPPEQKTFDIGVYYYSREDNDPTPSSTTLRVYIDGDLRHTYETDQLDELFDFWHAATIEWPDGQLDEKNQVTAGFP